MIRLFGQSEVQQRNGPSVTSRITKKQLNPISARRPTSTIFFHLFCIEILLSGDAPFFNQKGAMTRHDATVSSNLNSLCCLTALRPFGRQCKRSSPLPRIPARMGLQSRLLGGQPFPPLAIPTARRVLMHPAPLSCVFSCWVHHSIRQRNMQSETCTFRLFYLPGRSLSLPRRLEDRTLPRRLLLAFVFGKKD